jgi:hypothetical protein
MIEPALGALAQGRSGEAIARFQDIDRRLASLPNATSRILLSLRASILVISGQLTEFGTYFDEPLR